MKPIYFEFTPLLRWVTICRLTGDDLFALLALLALPPITAYAQHLAGERLFRLTYICGPNCGYQSRDDLCVQPLF